MPRKTIELFNEIKRKGLLQQIPSATERDSFDETSLDIDEWSLIIYLLTINALARLYDLPLSESIIKDIPSSYFPRRYIRNALIDMWVSVLDC